MTSINFISFLISFLKEYSRTKQNGNKMDLNRMKDEDKLVLSRKYFYGGFALLPFLWFVNAIWFFREAFLRKPTFDQQKAIKGYVIKSMVNVMMC